MGPAGDPICCLLTGLSETGHDRPVGVGRHIGHRMSSLDNPFVQKCGANGAECHLPDTLRYGACSLHMQTERSKYLGLLGWAHLTDGITHSGKEGAIVGRPALQVWQSHLLFPLVPSVDRPVALCRLLSGHHQNTSATFSATGVLAVSIVATNKLGCARARMVL